MTAEKTINVERAKSFEKPTLAERAKKHFNKERKMNSLARNEKGNMIRLGDIIIDPLYQVRVKIDSHAATEYAQLLRTRGDNPFPEIVVEEKTNKLVCGFTRMEAYHKVYSPDDMVPGIFKSFKNSADRLFYATEDNSSHGTPLSSWDKKNITLRLIHEGITVSKISNMLGWPIDKVQDYADVIIVHKNPKRQVVLETVEKKKAIDVPPKSEKSKVAFAVVNGKPEPLKRGLEHLDNKVVKPKVYENIKEHYSGWPAWYFANLIIMMIDDETLNLKDEKTMETMKELCEKLKGIGH